MRFRYLSYTVKPVLSSHWKRRPKIVFQDRLSLNAGQKYCMLQESILQYFRPSLSYHLSLRPLFCLFFGWPLKTGFTVCDKYRNSMFPFNICSGHSVWWVLSWFGGKIRLLNSCESSVSRWFTLNFKSYFDFFKQRHNLTMSFANVWCFKGKDAVMMKYVSPWR